MNHASKGDRENGRQLVSVAEAVPAPRHPYGRDVELYGGSSGYETGQPFGLNLLEYWRILYKHKWLILSITVAFAILSGVRTLMQTPLYTSTVRLQIDRELNVVEGRGDVAPLLSDWGEFMRTQFQVLESRTMAERVVSELKLGADAEFVKPRGFSVVGAVMGLLKPGPAPGAEGGDKTDRTAEAAGIVLANRAVKPVPNSRLVDIQYTDTDPRRAQRIANAYAHAFVASNIDKRFQANESAKVFLEDKIAQLKRRVEESESALVEFAQKQQIVAVDVDKKASVAEGNLATASNELATLTSERIKNETLWRQAEKADSINVPQLLSDDALKSLLSKRTELEIEYQEKLKTFKPLYPAMVDLRAKLDETNRQIGYQLETLKDSLKAAYETSLAQENEAKARVALLKDELLQLQKGSIEFNMAKREVDTNRELYTSLLQRYKEVDMAGGVGANTVFIVDMAAPGAPSSASLIKNLLTALVFGLAVGFAVAFLFEYFNDKVHSAEQVEQITGLSVLGIIPKVREVDQELADPRSSLCESHRSLCTVLQFATETGMPRTLTITSTGPGEGKSITALSIAKHFAGLGRKVLLVDADLRNPSQHVKLGCGNSLGLSNYLTGACAPPEIMQKTEIPTLAFIASGPLPPSAAELLGGARLVSLLSIGLEVFDLIVIDGPPMMEIADAQMLSSAASATLFVVGAGSSRKRFIRGAIRRLHLSHAYIVGAVLTKYDTKLPGYNYNYGYGYAGMHPRELSIRIPAVEHPQLIDSRESA